MNDTREESVSDAERNELVTVFVGPLPEVYVAQSMLEDQGFQTHIASENIKTIQPFVTGMNPLDAELQVPAFMAAGAFQALEETRTRNKARQKKRKKRVEDRGDYGDDLITSLNDLSRRIRWGTLFVYFVPAAAVLGFIYIARTFPLETKPSCHRLTLASIGICWSIMLFLLILFATFLRSVGV